MGHDPNQNDSPVDQSGYSSTTPLNRDYRGSMTDTGNGLKADPPKPAEQSRKVTLYQHIWSDRKGYVSNHGEKTGTTKYADGKVSAGLGYYRFSARSTWGYDAAKGEWGLMPVDIQAQISVVHAEAEGKFKVGNWVKSLWGDDEPVPLKTTRVTRTMMAARVGDMTSHGTPLLPGIGSTNVFIGNLPAWRAAIDLHNCPVVRGTVPDGGGVVLAGSPNVYINFTPACRMADMVVEIPGGLNMIATGCATVLIGPKGDADYTETTEHPPEDDDDGMTLRAKATGDLDTASAQVTAGLISTDEKEAAQLKVKAIAAVARGEVSAGWYIPLPWGHEIDFGASAQGTALSIGAEGYAEAGHSLEDGEYVKFGGGAALGFGGGVGFTIGVK